eukprot:356877-Chlamydomonas_euryale.AAC.6
MRWRRHQQLPPALEIPAAAVLAVRTARTARAYRTRRTQARRTAASCSPARHSSQGGHSPRTAACRTAPRSQRRSSLAPHKQSRHTGHTLHTWTPRQPHRLAPLARQTGSAGPG